MTVDLATKEASGQLNVNGLFPTRRSGPDYAADVVVVHEVFVNVEGIRRPVILYEYKPQVPCTYKDINVSHMCEVLI